MGIFRGTGGTGDSTTDTTVTTVTEKAAEAASSATSAADSATSAANSASSASTSATNAATSESNAATSASNASTSETNAATSASQAATSATNSASSATASASSASSASTSATNAATSATAAQTAETNAETAETNAETAYANTLAIFGDATDVQNAVDDAEKLAINPEDSQYTLSDNTTTGYSALHYAAKAEDHKTAAEVSKNAAETAETAAETAQGLAETAKTAAETAQSAAETAQAAAELAQSNAETVYDDFDDRYLGTKSGDPLVDNDNEGLTTGTLYFNTTENEMRVYTGTAWVAVVDLAGDITVNSLTSNNDVVVKGNLEVQGTTITVDSATAQTIDLGDNDKIRFGDGDDLQIYHDGTDSYIANTTGTLKLSGNTDVTGNITVSGTVDGRDIAADGTTLDSALQNVIDDTTPQLGGVLDTNGNNIEFGDSTGAEVNRLKFGASDDLIIYHDGTHSYVTDNGTGNLRLKGFNVQIVSSGNETMGLFKPNEGASLWYDNSKKIETTSSGVDITGTVVADGLKIDSGVFDINLEGSLDALPADNDESHIFTTSGSGSGFFSKFGALGISSRNKDTTSSDIGFFTDKIQRLQVADGGYIYFFEDTGTTAKLTWDASAEELQFKDNVKAEFGDGGDLQIYHDGSASVISEQGTGSLIVKTSAFSLQNAAGSEFMGIASENSGVYLYFDGSQKLQTTSSGIDVTGTVTADGLTVAGAVTQKVSGNATLKVHADTDTSPVASLELQRGANDTWGADVYTDYRFRDEVGDLFIEQGSSGNTVALMKLGDNSDISFYADDGTSQDFYWDASASRLGLGTTTPATTLDVAGTVTADDEIIVDGASGAQVTIRDTGRNGLQLSQNNTGGGFIDLVDATENLHIRTQSTNNIRIQSSGDISFYDDAGSSEDLYWDASTSRLGLGTTSPVTELQTVGQVVGGTSGFGSNMVGFTGLGSFNSSTAVENIDALYLRKNGTDASSVSISLASAGGDSYYVGSRIKHIRSGSNSNGHLTFETKSDSSNNTTTERMRITDTGNVGIGTTSPSQKLHVQGSAPNVLIYSDTTTGGTLDFVDQTWQSQIQGASGGLAFKTGGTTESMRLNYQGRLGIGTTSPDGLLHLQGADVALILDDTDGTSTHQQTSLKSDNGNFRLQTRNSSNTFVSNDYLVQKGSSGATSHQWRIDNSEAMRIDSSGRLGIGTTSPSTPLDVSSSSGGGSEDIQTWTYAGTTTYNLKLKQIVSSGLVQYRFDLLNNGTSYNNNLVLDRGKVGIGTTSPATVFEVKSAGNTAETVAQFGNLNIEGGLQIKTNGNLEWGFNALNSRSLTFSTNQTERMRIDSSGNVGIGTTSPEEPLTVQSGLYTGTIRIGADANAGTLTNATQKIARINAPHYTNAEEDMFVLGTSTSSNQNVLYLGGGSGNHNAATDIRFYTASNHTTTTGSEAARIDSSGNLLVGKTSASSATVGQELKSSGVAIFTQSANPPIITNRLSTDGEIVNFRKDGSTVGSIGTAFGNSYFASSSKGIRFRTNDMLPVNASGGSAVDAQVDLGISTHRWRNLYLSGGVYLGGTGSANLLDDYEEGTWTPTFGGSTTDPSGVTYDLQTGNYTKIGRMVQCRIYLGTDAITSVGSGNLKIGPLPFAAAGLSQGVGVPQAHLFASDIVADNYVGFIVGGSTDLYLFRDNNGSPNYAQTSVLGTGTNDNRFWMTFTYMTP